MMCGMRLELLAMGAVCAAAVGWGAEWRTSEMGGWPKGNAFAAGDVVLVDSAVTQGWAASCAGALTVRAAEGGSVASDVTLDFSGVAGDLTLEGLGTSEVRLASPVLNKKKVTLRDCWFSAFTLKEANAGIAVVTEGTGALGTYDAISTKDGNRSSLTIDGTWETTALKSSYKGDGTLLLTLTVSEEATLTVTDALVTGNMGLTVAGTLCCEKGFVSTARNYRSVTLRILSGGEMSVKGDFLHGNGWNQNFNVYNEGTLSVTGKVLVNISNDKGVLTSSGTFTVGSLEHKGYPAELSFTGGTVRLSGNWTGTSGKRSTFSGAALEVTTTVTVSEALQLDATLPLIVPSTATLTLSGALTGEGALDLSQNAGTVKLGTNRPALAAVAGTVALTPSAEEGTQIVFPWTGEATKIPASMFSLPTEWQLEKVTCADGSVVLTRKAESVTLSKASTKLSELELPTDASQPISIEVSPELPEAELVVDVPLTGRELVFDVGEGKSLSLTVDAERGSLTVIKTSVLSGTVDASATAGSFGALGVSKGATFVMGATTVLASRIGAGTLAFEGEGAWDMATAKTLFLPDVGGFEKRGAGRLQVTLDASSGPGPQTIAVSGGTLRLHQSSHANRTFQSLAVAEGAEFCHAATWGSSVTLAGALRGEGTVRATAHTSGGQASREVAVSGVAAEFQGTLRGEGVTLSLSPSDGIIGGDVETAPGGSSTHGIVFGAAAVRVAGTLSLGTKATLTLEGATPTVGAFVLEAPVTVTLKDAAPCATVLSLVEGSAEQAVADRMALAGTTAETAYVVALGKDYRLAPTLPELESSETEGGTAYSEATKLTLGRAAVSAGLPAVDTVKVSLRGGTVARAATFAEANAALACFENIVEGDAAAKTLTVRYDFGIGAIRPASSSETWEAVARVRGPEGARFAKGATVQVCHARTQEVLASATVETPTAEVTISGIPISGTGTHPLRVRVLAP